MYTSTLRASSRLAVLVVSGALGIGAATAADRGVQATFNQPLTVVHKAAVDALVSIGATIGNDEPTAVDGKRPGKGGASGGETVAVALADIGEGKVLVDVRTSKTANQKSWDQPVISAMTKALAGLPPAPAQPAAEASTAPAADASTEPAAESPSEPAAQPEPASDPKP